MLKRHDALNLIQYVQVALILRYKKIIRFRMAFMKV